MTRTTMSSSLGGKASALETVVRAFGLGTGAFGLWLDPARLDVRDADCRRASLWTSHLRCGHYL